MNYQKQLYSIIKQNEKENKVPTILLHTCCAPCSTTVLNILAQCFHVTVFYYNPNIEPKEEYEKRKSEQKRLLTQFPAKYPISFLDYDYEPEVFHQKIKGLEEEPERGERCFECYTLRLEKTAQKAKELNMDYFGTSLTVSPYKNAQWLNEIGEQLAKKYQISFLYSDFKKDQGYLKSIEFSNEYHLYRQDFCGCVYSKREREVKKLATKV